MANHQGTALVTGASAGIGAAYAEQLARRGYDLVLVARSADRLEAVAARLRAETGRTVETLPADLTDPVSLRAVAERLTDDPAITLLVNNAGVALGGKGLLDTAEAEIDRLVALNVTAPTHLAAAAGRAFAARGSGKIVNVASVVALAPELFEGVYGGSKAYVLNFSRNLSAALRDKGVTVQAVLPGLTRTEILDDTSMSFEDFPAEMVMEADDLVAAALAGLDRGESVTVPPLHDEGLWRDFEAARAALEPHLSSRDPAPRYRVPEPA